MNEPYNGYNFLLHLTITETPKPMNEYIKCPCCETSYSQVDAPAEWTRVKNWSPGRTMGRLGGKTTGPTKARANRGADWGKSLAQAKATKKAKRLSEATQEPQTRGLACPQTRPKGRGEVPTSPTKQNASQPMVRGSNV